jgi:AAA family ATP:ADP antiporter
LGFFAIFAFVIYPFKDFLHPSLESILAWQEKYPNVKWILSLYGIWSYSIFYVLAELWGVVVVSLLFWQFANEITSTDEAKRFYPLFGLVGNFALMASGLFIEWLSITCESSSLTSDPWRVRLTWVIVVILIVGVGIFLLYWLASRRCSTNECNSKTSKKIEEQSSKAKLKLSFIESLQYVFSSKYIGLVAVLVVCFGVSMNLIDVTWKSQIKACFPDPIDYFKFMGRFSILTGVGTITIIFLTKGFIGRFGWKIAAIITPVILLITSTIFFSFIISQERIDNMIGKFGFSTVFLALIIGAGQNIFTKGIKYSLFDSTKEMTYIPLDPELKAKGKAAVDVIGGRLGKSGGGFIQIILLTLTGGDQLFIAPYLFGIVFVVVLIWIVAIPALSQLYYSKLSENRSGR